MVKTAKRECREGMGGCFRNLKFMTPEAPEATPEQIQAVPEKFRTLISKLAGNNEVMRRAIVDYIAKDTSYINTEQKTLLQTMDSDNPDLYGITEENLKGNWEDSGKVPELMGKFRTECLEKVIVYLQKEKTEKEVKSRYDLVNTELGVLKDFADMDAALKKLVTDLLVEVSAFKPEVIDIPLDQRQTKVVEFETRYKELFAKYRTPAIEKLKTEGLNTGEYDASTLASIEKPSEFKTKVAEMRDKKKAEDDIASTPPAESTDAIDVISEAVSEGTGLQGILDKLMNSDNAFLATLAGIAAMLLGMNPGGIFDGLIGSMEPSETREVFLDLITGKQKLINHPKDKIETFKTFKEKQTAAISWFENLDVGGNKVGKRERLCHSLFNTEFTIGKLRELAKGHNEPENLDVEDLPGEYQNDFGAVKAVYDQVLAKAPSDGSKDATSLVEFIADFISQPQQDTQPQA